MIAERVSPSRLASLFRKAIADVEARDKALLAVQAHEQALAHRLAVYLERRLGSLVPNANWHVDCEYNRNLLDVKRLQCCACDRKIHAIKPDIVVHKRRSEGENLLVVELKVGQERPARRDKCKIKCLVEQYGYRFGLFLTLKLGANGKVRVVDSFALTRNSPGATGQVKHWKWMGEEKERSVG